MEIQELSFVIGAFTSIIFIYLVKFVMAFFDGLDNKSRQYPKYYTSLWKLGMIFRVKKDSNKPKKPD